MNRQKEYQDLIQELEQTPQEMTQMSANTKPRARRRTIIKGTVMPTGMLMASLLVIIVASYISPTVAYAFERIPVLRQITAAVSTSPSLREAIAHEFIQPIGQEQTIDGITMRIEYVIVDQRQLNIFYTVTSQSYPVVSSSTSVLCIEENQHLPVSIFGTWHEDNQYEGGRIHQAVINFFDQQVPGQLIMEAQVHGLEAPQLEAAIPVPVEAPPPAGPAYIELESLTTFRFTLEFDPNFTEQGEKIYVNQDFVIDGQHLTLTTVEIYPTHMRANFTADPANTAWMTSLHFFAENQQGHRFEAISNGITAFGGDGGSPMMVSHVLHSPFFFESSSLTLFIEQVVWLDKDMQRVRIDLAKGTAYRLPEGVTLYEARRDGSAWHMSFTVEEREENHSHQIFSTTYYDEAGTEHRFTSWTSSSMFCDDTNDLTTGEFIVQFTISNYPYDIVYLVPTYSRVARPHQPTVLKVR